MTILNKLNNFPLKGAGFQAGSKGKRYVSAAKVKADGTEGLYPSDDPYRG